MGKLDIIEENISKLEDIATEITQNKTEQKKNLMKKWLKTFPNLVKAILFFFSFNILLPKFVLVPIYHVKMWFQRL